MIIKRKRLIQMIESSKFNKAKKYLYLESAYPLLHETSKEKIGSIMTKGLNLDKQYNGQIDRVVSFPKNEEEFKHYNYYMDRIKKTILVLGIPKIILGKISPYSANGHLLLNCITEFQNPKVKKPSNGFQFHELKRQKLFSTIPIKWILGYFDENSRFFPNPNYIMSQENAGELIVSSKQEILKKFYLTYPDLYHQLFGKRSPSSTLDYEIER